MDRYTFDIVTQCAQTVRNWAEDQSDDTLLGGWCARCAAELWYLLDDAGIKAEIRMHVARNGSPHVFLVVEDHIVDVTATQFEPFRKHPILIIHERETSYRYFEPTDFFANPKELLKSQKATNWHKDQMAFRSRQIACVAA